MAKENGGIIGVVNTPTTSVASGVWASQDQYNARVGDIWPGQPPYSIDFLVVAGGGWWRCRIYWRWWWWCWCWWL
jgi:hypothetical protein